MSRRSALEGLPVIGAALLALVAAPSGARASDDTAVQAEGEAEAEAEPSGARFSGSVSVGWVSQYYFRGIVQETSGAIFQPGADVGLNLFSGSGAVSSVDLHAGVWASIHDGPTGDLAPTTVGPAHWYEADLTAGLSLTFAEMIGLDIAYVGYFSPNGRFATVHELDVGLSGDDSSAWTDAIDGRFGGFQPWLTLAAELDGSAFGANSGLYLELGIAPSFALVDHDAVSLGLSIPVAVGLGLGDYYDPAGGAEVFGTFSAGASLDLGLAFIPAPYGEWTLSAGANALLLGDALAAANAGGDSFELLGTVGLGVAY